MSCYDSLPKKKKGEENSMCNIQTDKIIIKEKWRDRHTEEKQFFLLLSNRQPKIWSLIWIYKHLSTFAYIFSLNAGNSLSNIFDR